jgi:hypothetical protein
MSERKSTMVELVDELTKRNKDGKYDELISEAKAGEYHDYKNKKHACGKVAFCADASKFPELNDLIQDVQHGVYDEVADADDKAMMIQDLKDNCSSPQEAERMIKMLGLDK